jgi:tight adherence protein B
VRLKVGIALAAAAAALGSLAATAGAASSPLRLTEAGQTTFPERALILSMPTGERIQASSVRVSENGHGVVGLKVKPLGTPGASTGTVLAVDASNSMKGAPIKGAVDAARAFAARRNVNQSLGILTFNGATSVVLGLTKSQDAVNKALAKQPALAYGTHLYDAVAQGVSLLQTSGVPTGSIIVLSDGADIGSKLDLPAAIQIAKDAHVRVFTVGLRSKTFRPGPLQQLAGQTGGTFRGADSPGALAGIYSALGLELAHEYLLNYKSTVTPGHKVDVNVSVAGIGSTANGYVAPVIASPTAIFHPSRLDHVWQSSITMFIIALLIAGLLTAAVLVPLRGGRSTVRTRVSDYVTMPSRKREGEALVSRVFVGTERTLEQTRWWQRFKDTLQFADINIPPVQVVVGTLVLTLFAMWLFSRIAGPLFLVGLGVPLVIRALIMGRVSRKRRLFGDQLADNLDVLASGLRAGHSLVGSLATVVADAPEPSRSEFQRVVADEQLGIELADALGAVGKRMRNRDMEQVALVAAVQNETGGNAAEVLDRVVESIRERQELRRLVRTLTAQGRLARWVVSLLPVALLILISTINSTYMKPMFTHASGKAMLTIAALMIIAGSVVIGKVVDIKV